MSARTPVGVPAPARRSPILPWDGPGVPRRTSSTIAYERSFDTGELLVREGDPADEFLLVFSGKVALEIVLPGRPRTTIQTLGPGEVIGWSWLFPPHRWRLDARALKPTRALGLAAAHLRAVLERGPGARLRVPVAAPPGDRRATREHPAAAPRPPRGLRWRRMGPEPKRLPVPGPRSRTRSERGSRRPRTPSPSS